MITKRFLSAALICVVGASLLALAACGGADEPAPPDTNTPAPPDTGTPAASSLEDRLYEAALEEGGTVVIWDSANPEDIAPIFDAFEATYSGMEVEHVTGSEATSLYQKYILEHDSDNVTLDVMTAGVQDVDPLLERDAFMDLNPLVADVGGEDMLELDGRLYLEGVNVAGIPYNTNRASDDEAPRNWEDLLDPKWSGQLVIESRLQPYILRTDVYGGTREGDYWSEEEAVEFLTRLRQQDFTTHRGNSASLQQVISGERAILAGNWIASAWRAMADGAPLGWSPIPVLPGEQTLAWISEKAPHPNAAQLYVRWRISEDGIRAKTSTNPEDLPFPPDNPVADMFAEKGNELLLAGPEIFDEYNRLQDKYIEALGIR